MTKAKRRILILGVGNAQVDLINYCQKANLEVHGCSYRAEGPGLAMVDAFSVIDIGDVAGIVKYCTEAKIDHVYSIGSDIAIPTVMAVCEQIGLPAFLDSAVAADMQCKDIVRRSFEGSEFDVAFKSLKTVGDLDNWVVFPAMIKPADSQGQRGVVRVDSVEEARQAFANAQSFSKCGRVVIEEFIAGDEISVNAYLYNGDLISSSLSDRLVYEQYPGGIPREHLVPSRYENDVILGKVESLIAEISNRLKIYNGPLYVQAITDGTTVKPVEIAPRLDGCHMWRLIKYSSNIDLLDMTLKHLLGEELPPNLKTSKRKFIKNSLQFMSEPPGQKFKKSNHDLAGWCFSHWYYGDGEVVGEINGFTEKVGYRIKNRTGEIS